MRFQFYIQRPTENTKLGLKYLGMDLLYAPIVITEKMPEGLVAKENERILKEARPLHTVQPQDIILAVNHCTKEEHGAEMMRIALQGDRQLTFELHRMDSDPWDIRRVPAEDHCNDPPGGCEPAQEKQNDWRRNETRPYAQGLSVDPFAVRFTHDKISHSFRDGSP